MAFGSVLEKSDEISGMNNCGWDEDRRAARASSAPHVYGEGRCEPACNLRVKTQFQCVNFELLLRG